MHVTNCCILLSEAGFCFDILFLFPELYFNSHEHVTDAFGVKLSCMICVDSIHDLKSVLYLVRLVFSCKTLGFEGLS